MRGFPRLSILIAISLLCLIASACSVTKDGDKKPAGLKAGDHEIPETGCTQIFGKPEGAVVGEGRISVSVEISGELGSADDGRVIIDVIQESAIKEAGGASVGLHCALEKSLTFEVPAGLGASRLAAFYVTDGVVPSDDVPAAVSGLLELGDEDVKGIKLMLTRDADFGNLAYMYKNRSATDSPDPVKP